MICEISLFSNLGLSLLHASPRLRTAAIYTKRIRPRNIYTLSFTDMECLICIIFGQRLIQVERQSC